MTKNLYEVGKLYKLEPAKTNPDNRMGQFVFGCNNFKKEGVIILILKHHHINHYYTILLNNKMYELYTNVRVQYFDLTKIQQ